jgi:hypothetical protein
MEARSSQPGPTVWLTGCVHGDEVGGIAVTQEVFKRLKKEPLTRGTLCAFPLMNPVGFETASRHIGLSKEDLNRAFPGTPTGSVAERIAEKIFSTIVATKPSLVLDLHNDWIKSIPYVLIDPRSLDRKTVRGETTRFAKRTGFVIVNEGESGTFGQNMARTLTGSLTRRGIPALTLELGESHIVNEKMVEAGVTAVWNILAALSMVKRHAGHRFPWSSDRFSGRTFEYCHEPAASTSGIVRFLVTPGQSISKGDKVARIYNVFGKLQETIRVGGNGVVLGHSDTSVALPGMPVAAFGFA